MNSNVTPIEDLRKDALVHYDEASKAISHWNSFVRDAILEYKKPQQRYILVGDDSGHKYVIPEEKADDWSAFMDLPEDDPASWDVPEWAKRVEGKFTFTDPKTD